MVLASSHLQSCNMENGQTPSSVQCSVSDLALYRLPTSIRPESLEFENLLLQCVKSNLANRNKNEDSDLNRTIIRETGECDSHHSSSIDQLSQHHFVVCIEPNRLLWASLKSSVNDGGKFNLGRHTCMQICFSEIKLCYVSIQLPNIVIWLLSSIPQKIVKNESLTTKCNNQQVKPKCLYALVWQCFRENDVVSLRQVYKHLRSTKKLRPSESSLLSKLVSAAEFESACQRKHHSEVDTQPSKVFNGLMGKGHKVLSQPGQHILSRQRQPAKLIHENTSFGHTATLERKSESTNLSHKKGFSNTIRPFTIQSESEFDTTQITNYLSQNSKSLKGSNKMRTRSRSVESPRHRFRMVYKPINDDIEILIPSYHANKCDTLGKSERRNESDTDNKSKAYSDSLNSEGSSISDESTSGEYVPSSLEYEYFNLSKLCGETSPKSSTPIVIKSVLKKSSSYFDGQKNARMPRSCFFLGNSAPGDRSKFALENRNLSAKSRQCANLHNKKNVTFSAYATIQVVDN